MRNLLWWKSCPKRNLANGKGKFFNAKYFNLNFFLTLYDFPSRNVFTRMVKVEIDPRISLFSYSNFFLMTSHRMKVRGLVPGNFKSST
jgi:hypothetical protein